MVIYSNKKYSHHPKIMLNIWQIYDIIFGREGAEIVLANIESCKHICKKYKSFVQNYSHVHPVSWGWLSGRPKAEQPAGWRPRERCDTWPKRPASAEEPAAPAADQDLLHWRLKPAMTTKSLTDALLNLARARQERQKLETRVTPATKGLHQTHHANPLFMKGSEASRGHIPRICRSRGQMHFIK
jgi:hypothetical protein